MVGTDALSANYNGLWPELGHWTHPVTQTPSTRGQDWERPGARDQEYMSSLRSSSHLWTPVISPGWS